ncbi:hypothetical protein ES703_51293 [subsurface metagenome]
MKHELWYSVVVRDRHGKVLSRERRKSRSLLKQWNQLVYAHMASTALIITDTGGTPRNISADGFSFQMKAVAGNDDYGIRVGTGNTPVAIDDYALETPIAEGTGAGQMEHLLCTVADFVVAAPSCSFLTSRSIVNNSPGIITVREAAIYMKMEGIVTYYGCGARDVFNSPQAVPVGGAITIDWTIQATV